MAQASFMKSLSRAPFPPRLRRHIVEQARGSETSHSFINGYLVYNFLVPKSILLHASRRIRPRPKEQNIRSASPFTERYVSPR